MGAGVVTRRVQEHLTPAARQTDGYRGFLPIIQGDGNRTVLLLFDSMDNVPAAQQTLTRSAAIRPTS